MLGVVEEFRMRGIYVVSDCKRVARKGKGVNWKGDVGNGVGGTGDMRWEKKGRWKIEEGKR